MVGVWGVLVGVELGEEEEEEEEEEELTWGMVDFGHRSWIGSGWKLWVVEERVLWGRGCEGGCMEEV